MPRMIRALAIVPLLVFTSLAAAQFGGDQPVTVRTEWSVDQARPGDQRVLAIVFGIERHFHINPDADQLPEQLSFLIPTTVEVDTGDAPVTIGPVQFPLPHTVEVNYTGEPSPLPVFEDGAVFYLPVIVDDAAPPGDVTLRLTVNYQACDAMVCLPPHTVEREVTLTVVSPDAAVATTIQDEAMFADFDASIFSQLQSGKSLPQNVSFDMFGLSFSLDAATSLGLLLLLLAAMFGGLLLNFTPCVLPVIPIKIMGLSRTAGNRMRCFALGVAMALGVVGFWVALGVLIAAVAGFTATNQLFQYPVFTIGVGAVIAIMAIGMCGLFAVRLPQFVYRVSPKHDTLVGSFGFGIMTAVLSTPCTAPFMGAAAAWAATQAPAITLTTFASIGFGMALPYLVLAAAPHLVEKMPRTGPASELIKQVMGLLMLAAAAYFIGVGLAGILVTPPDPPSRLYWGPVALFIVAAGAWLIYRTVKITPSVAKRGVWGVLGVIAIVGSIYGATQLTAKGPIDWIYYTPDRFEQALADGNIVVMDFTAEWCLNCKALEHAVLQTDVVADILNGPGVVPIKVDLTGNNVVGNEMLRRTGRVAIPLLVIFAPDGSEVFKSDAYTAGQVTVAIAEARGETDRQAAAR